MDENPRVMTTNGPVQGIRQGDVNVFKGLRYAAPPKGELRWKPPVLPEKWTETAQATSFGPACPQQPDKMFGRLKDMDEDCLFLNVWAPKAASGAPVIVWLHGGSFVSGKGSQGIFDGYWLAESGAVVVTLNYRLGPFGFLAHPLLTDESEHGTSGNYGLLDQQMALEWVRDNISAFGGDPGNVSLFGQSSGAISACVHMTRPQTEGLFHRVLAMSAFVVMGLRELDREFRGLSSMHSKGEEFFENLGVRNLDEARAVSQEALLNADKTGDRMAVPPPWKT
ncbi:MAG: carboxylesterase family protein [Planctomycetota bacterium]|nr:carboxylesterase family protein [Planctomycetota bacterium]